MHGTSLERKFILLCNKCGSANEKPSVFEKNSISGSTPFLIRLPLPQGPICPLRLGAGLRWSGKDAEASVGKGSFKLLIYINKNIR